MTDPVYGDHEFDSYFGMRRAKAHVAKALATEGCGRAGRPSEPT
jgi:hypothetical protein